MKYINVMKMLLLSGLLSVSSNVLSDSSDTTLNLAAKHFAVPTDEMIILKNDDAMETVWGDKYIQVNVYDGDTIVGSNSVDCNVNGLCYLTYNDHHNSLMKTLAIAFCNGYECFNLDKTVD